MQELVHHPRPQLQREAWESLDGEWDFRFDDDDCGLSKAWEINGTWDKTIRVPFTYETELSGINDKTQHGVVWYYREFSATRRSVDNRVILHFEGVDYSTTVWINGRYAGDHQGAYSRFSLDITDLLNTLGKPNQLALRVEDSFDMEQVRGKQRWKGSNFGCWYVQNTGIWKSVWLEYVGSSYIKSVKIIPDVDKSQVELDFNLEINDKNIMVEAEITFKGNLINRSGSFPNDRLYRISMSVEDKREPFGLRLWFPQGFRGLKTEGPQLYDLKITLKKDGAVVDMCSSYFGMRKISIEDGQILINNMPLYQKLILDQGYWPESSTTPPNEEALIRDLEIILEAGYNGVRKHQKTEDERFLYHCDKMGILVWGEIGSFYRFSDRSRRDFTRQWTEVLEQFHNHPSIITWVPFNESWGIPQIATSREQQNFVNGIYYLTKSFDPQRPVMTNDGWEHTISDILTLHDYEETGAVLRKRYEDKEKLVSGMNASAGMKRVFAKDFSYSGQPVILSEYGGIAFSSDEGWGYGKGVRNEVEFLRRFGDITRAVRSIPYLSGFCYTQVSDVEQEVNGIVNEKREPKVSLEKLRSINR